MIAVVTHSSTVVKSVLVRAVDVGLLRAGRQGRQREGVNSLWHFARYYFGCHKRRPLVSVPNPRSDHDRLGVRVELELEASRVENAAVLGNMNLFFLRFCRLALFRGHDLLNPLMRCEIMWVERI